MMEEQIKKTKIVCAGNMKGGVTKTTSTLIMALELALRYHKKIIVLDCDEQGTITKTRQGDIDSKPEWPAPYEIQEVKLAHIIPKVKELKALGIYDYIFIDMPRITEDMDNKETSFAIIQLLAIIDILFIPFIANTMELQATTDFMEYVRDVAEWRKEKGYPFKYIGFQSKWVNKIENKEIPVWAKHIGLPLMKNVIKDNVLISRHYSTFFSLMSRRGGKELLEKFVNEVHEILG